MSKYKKYLENNLGVKGYINNGDHPPDNVENLETNCLEDLKYIALCTCIEIYDDFDITEINNMPESYKLAWEVGRSLRLYKGK